MPFPFGSCLDRSGLQSTTGRSARGAEPGSPGTGVQEKQGGSRTGARLARHRSSQSTVMPREFKLIPTEIKLV